MDLGYHVSDVPTSDGPLQIRTCSSGTHLQWKQQCHNDHQGQLVPMEHPVHRQGCANDQPRRYHQVPVEFHFSGRTPGYMTSPFLWPGKAPSAAEAIRHLQQVEFFMKICRAKCNNEKNLGKGREVTEWERYYLKVKLLHVHFRFEELEVITSLSKGSKTTDFPFTPAVFVLLNV